MVRKTIWLFLVGILLISVGQVFATDLGISPPDIAVSLNRGEEFQGEIYVFGSDKETTQVAGYVNDWSLSTSGDYQFLPAGTLKRSASPWITFSPKIFQLPPKRGQKVQYTVKVPANASGSYWCTILFSSTPPPKSEKDKVQIVMAARVAYIVRINVNGSQPGIGNIERFKLEWDAKLHKVASTLRLKNSGSSFIRVKGRLELKNSQGKSAGVIPFNEGLLLPDYTREYTLVPNDLKLTPGTYVGVAVVDFGEKSLKATQATFEVK